MKRVVALLFTVLPAVLRAQHASLVTPLGMSMERIGSGTTWIPDAVPLPVRHGRLGAWSVMMHGFVFVQYDQQGGPRGARQFGSLNWAMLMASRNVAGGRLQARTMLSLDPATVSVRGYPLLLQTGESYHGQPLHDRQHPHDFWMELGAMYERAIARGLGFEIYAAPSGEPALGPVAFMHRPSGMDNPLAPLSHHWQDATHISFGVLTAGIFGRSWKLEGSAFNGREPDDERWGFDRLRWDSYSGRLTVNPGSTTSLSVGYGFLKSPDQLAPAISEHRLTASLLYGGHVGAHGARTVTVVWGANVRGGSVTHSVLLEGEVISNGRDTFLGRWEIVQKTAADLVLPPPSGFPPDARFSIASLSAGWIRDVWRGGWSTLGIGVQPIVGLIPVSLRPFYGSRTPAGALLFVRFKPLHGPHGMAEMPGMSMP